MMFFYQCIIQDEDISISDQTWFYLPRYVNLQNIRLWSSENPDFFCSKNHYIPRKLVFWLEYFEEDLWVLVLSWVYNLQCSHHVLLSVDYLRWGYPWSDLVSSFWIRKFAEYKVVVLTESWKNHYNSKKLAFGLKYIDWWHHLVVGLMRTWVGGEKYLYLYQQRSRSKNIDKSQKRAELIKKNYKDLHNDHLIRHILRLLSYLCAS